MVGGYVRVVCKLLFLLVFLLIVIIVEIWVLLVCMIRFVEIK